MTTEIEHIEPDESQLRKADEGALAALESVLSGEPQPAAEPAAGEPEAAAVADPEEAAAPAADAVTDPVDPAAEPVAAVPDKPADAADPRPSDELGELPKDVKAETRERFETMRTRYDELHVRAAAAEQRAQAEAEQVQKWVHTVESTGATPEQFGNALAILSLVNSRDPQGMRKGYDMLQAQMTELAKQLDIEVPGVHDPLAAHPDLQEKVAEMQVDRESALEIAAARKQRALASTANETSREEAARAQAEEAGHTALRTMAAQLHASDPQYVQKINAIRPIVERVVAKLPPAEWAEAVKDAYAAVQIAPAVAPAPTVAPTPLRPTATPAVGGGGLSKNPGSPLEAMELALQNF